MGTKNQPGKFDCYSKALPDEPMFILLARDPDFYRLVNEWANKRELDISCGERPASDGPLVREVRICAAQAANWRRQNLGAWRDNKK
ncbi:MAG: hypothetical protein KGI58_03875 [Patescibacteria group bacterium]|nr:hypothetical protein [Patescibacteria group bacterium]